MVLLTEIKTSHVLYPCVESLLNSAFPSNERRDDAMQRFYTENKDNFHCLVATIDNSFVGFITYWELTGFLYIEHLAVSSLYRCRGYGHEMLKRFMAFAPSPIVLEVEPPVDLVCKKRISFYQRCGMVLWDCDYLQPPYKLSDEWIKLCLMRTESFSVSYSCVQAEIYREVYGIDLLN